MDIDPYGNVQACMHLQQSAGNLHRQSIADIWHNSPVFSLARTRSLQATADFASDSPRQLGAPAYCIAVEENLNKGASAPCGGCGGGCS